MAQVLVSVKNLTNIANAIRNKTQSQKSYKPPQMASAINDIPDKNITNAIIEKYKALQEPVDAFTFVEVINKINVDDEETIGLYYNAKAIALSSSQLIVLHAKDSTNNQLYALSCSISNNQISADYDTSISTTNNTARTFDGSAISDNSIFVAYDAGDGTLVAQVCTFTSSGIMSGTIYGGAIASYSNYVSVTALSRTKVFISYGSDNTNYYLMGIVCSVGDSSISRGTAVTLSNVSYSAYDSKSVTLTDSKVFVMHSSGGRFGGAINGIVCTISGTVITVGTDTTLYNQVEISSGSTCDALSDTKVIIAHQWESTTYLAGTVCTINGAAITTGANTLLVPENYTGSSISVAALSDSKVFIAHSSSGGNSYLNGLSCTISGTKISPGADTTLSNSVYSSFYARVVKVNSNQAFITHSYGSSGTALVGTLCTPETVIKKATTKIGGITKEACGSAYAGDVWILE